MLKALHYCHNVIQVIHRDIKPENIMINHNKEAVLIDFGISFLVDQQENDEMKTINIGTFNYYAPEMWVKKFDQDNNIVYNKGELTDLWALGITFFRLITGRYPYENATSVMKIKEFILNKEIDFSIIKNDDVKSLL
jgi:serine/threonine protein kinase